MKRNKSVLITGASTGIGRQCALDLSSAGYTVFAGVRDHFEPFPKASGIAPIKLDVTDANDIAQAVETITGKIDTGGQTGLCALVNNAGIAVGGPLEFAPLEEIRHQFEVNVFGQIACIQAFMPLLRNYGKGAKIINMSSIAGRSYLPFASPYSASKHALEAFSDALRVELSPWGIQVVLIEPGVIATPIWEKALTTIQLKKNAYSKIIPDNTPNNIMTLYKPFLAILEKQITQSANKGISVNVVSRQIASILNASQPKHRYLLGNDAKIRSLLNCLPTPILDMLIRYYLNRKSLA